MSLYYRRDGSPVDDMLTWAKEFETSDRIVAKTKVGEGEVSTVFLGMDHSFGDGPPLIFETMIFGGRLDDECERYSTEAEAVAGHDHMVARVRALDVDETP